MKRRRRSKTNISPVNIIVLATVLGIITVVSLSKLGLVAVLGNNVLGSYRYLAKGGDDDGGDNSGSGSNSGSSGSGSSGSGSSGSDGSDTRTRTTTTRQAEQENETETGLRTRTETRPQETRNEVRLSETERIRVRTKDGRTRVDVTSSGVKVRLEYRDDRVVVKAEQEDGTETELEDDTILKVDERLAKDNIKVATAGGDRFVIQRGNSGAVTTFPLSIDLATNTLIVTTPTGEKPVAVLPDQAVQNLLAANIVTRLGGQAIVEGFETGGLMSVSDVIQLGEQNGIPVYEIAGLSDQRLLGFIPLAIEKTVTVSAETGEILNTQTSLLNQMLDVLAI